MLSVSVCATILILDSNSEVIQAFFLNNFEYTTAVDLIKCLDQIILLIADMRSCIWVTISYTYNGLYNVFYMNILLILTQYDVSPWD